ncbi:ankyrin repeat domain-containing protein [Favolaschia claudopus]|uniref:Ankyrin repeat domain-containing protein n=1 Tax=Favolaschia claudopus TaxID=2862362 RepID=A0AAW0CGU6_9AGAR
MADLIGVVASILQLVDMVSRARHLIVGVRDAPEEQQKLFSEIQSLGALVTQLHRRLEACQFPDILNGAPQFRDSLVQAKETLERLTSKLSSTSKLSKLPARLAWPLWKKEDIHNGLNALERFKTLLAVWLGMGNWDSSEGIKSTISELAQDQKTHCSSLARDEMLDWFSPINPFLRHADISYMQQSGTGRWFLQDSVFERWKSGSLRTLWCRGMPGAGKTVLASLVVDELRETFDTQQVGVAVMYLNHKETEMQTVPNVLTALWRQLTLGKPLSPAEMQVYAKHREQRTRPSLHEVDSILRSTLSQFSRAFVVIDALDEYPEVSREVLLRHLSSLPANTSLMLTSRPHITIKHVITEWDTMEIRATEDDIRRYVDAQISRSARLCGHIKNQPVLRDEIEANIVQRCGGMFLLAKLHIDSLATKTTIRAVRQCLRNLPGNLHSTYNEVMERISRQCEDDVDLAHRTLAWVFNAKRLLRPAELREALAVEVGTTELDPDNFHDIDTILSVCAGLVIVNTEDDRVCLVHYTAQSYLECAQHQLFPRAQTDVATTCLTYLMFDAFAAKRHPVLDDSIFSPKPSTNCLLNYVLNYGVSHAQGQPESGAPALISTFLERRSSWLGLWNRVYYYNTIPDSATKMWVAAFFGLQDTVRRFIAEEGVVDSGAVYAASVNGHAGIAEALIQAGAQVDSIGGYHGTALQAAACTGNESMLRVLIQHGANLDFQTKRYNNALYKASRRGYEAIVRLLVENGANVNIQTAEHGTALQMAAHGGHGGIVRLLLAHGADVNVHYGEQLTATALQLASVEGHLDIIQILLDNGADINFQTEERGSALYGASLMQNYAAVALLIAHRADVNARGPEGTCLQVAAADGNEAMVRLLLCNGASVNAVGPNGTALQVAARGKHANIVFLLLQHGAHVTKFQVIPRPAPCTSFFKQIIVPPSPCHLPARIVLRRQISWS